MLDCGPTCSETDLVSADTNAPDTCRHDPKDPGNAQALETFLTAYDHVPAELPAGFTH